MQALASSGFLGAEVVTIELLQQLRPRRPYRADRQHTHPQPRHQSQAQQHQSFGRYRHRKISHQAPSSEYAHNPQGTSNFLGRRCRVITEATVLLNTTVRLASASPMQWAGADTHWYSELEWNDILSTRAHPEHKSMRVQVPLLAGSARRRRGLNYPGSGRKRAARGTAMWRLLIKSTVSNARESSASISGSRSASHISH